MYCKNCGEQLKENATFCVKCGTKLNESIPQYQQVQPNQYNQMTNKKNKGFMHYELIFLGIAVGQFFLITMITIIIGLVTGRPISDAQDPILRIIGKGILPTLQISVPILLFIFGPIISLILSNKNK